MMLLGPDGKPIREPYTDIYQPEFLKSLFKVLPNPEPVLRKAGKSIDVYDEILSDAHVYAVLQSRKAGVLSKSWDIEPAGEKRQDKKIAEFVREVFSYLDVFTLMDHLLSAVFYGFAVAELVWTSDDSRWWIDDFRLWPARHFVFDEEGNLRIKLSMVDFEGEKVKPFKFVLVRHGGNVVNPYGEALGAKVFWWWFFKKNTVKFWNVLAEKYGMPLAIGKYPRSASESDKNSLESALWSMVQDAITVISEDMEIDFKNPEAKLGADLYRELIDVCNAEISKAILSQTLTTQVGERGSYAAAKTHLDVRQDVIERDAKMLMGAITEQVIYPLVLFNFGDIKPPRFVIRYEEEELKVEKAKRDQILWQMGYPISQKYIEKEYGVPMAEEGEAVLPMPPQLEAGFSKDITEKEKRIEVEFVEDESDKRVFRRGEELGKFYEKALRQVKKHGDELASEIERVVKRAKAKEDLYEILKIIENDATQGIAEVQINTAFTAWLIGQAHFNEEVERKFQTQLEFDFGPMRPEDALKFFRDKVVIDPDTFYEIVENLRERYFSLAKIHDLELIARIKGELEATLAEGLTFRDFQVRVDGILRASGIRGINPHYWETVFRTNIQQAYHAGFFERMEKAKAIFPYWRYSAVLDSRTRPEHRALHGKIFRVEDTRYRPPLGFNCRCSAIPLTEEEARKLGVTDKSELKGISPDPGFETDPVMEWRSVPRVGWWEGGMPIPIERIPGICGEFAKIRALIERWLRRRVDKFCVPPIEIAVKNAVDIPELFPTYKGDDLLKYYSELLGDRRIKTPLSIVVKINAVSVVKHTIETVKGEPVGRLRELALLPDVLESPHEVWLNIEKLKRRYAPVLKFIKFYKVRDGRSYFALVGIDLKRGITEVYTAYPIKEPSKIDKKRWGWLIYLGY